MSTTTTTAVQINPFPGLRPFLEEEEYLFFGRESQVDAMVNKLAATHFLAVVGTSGSGKSSLVNCGLRPALHGGLMAHAGTAWRMAQFRPGSDPLRAMANALAQEGVLFHDYRTGGLTLTEIVDTTLRMSKLGLIDIYEQAQLDKDVNLLVVVDQFEELFRYRQLGTSQQETVYAASEAAAAFVNLLLEAKQQTTYPLYVALTMRSDFLGDCTQFQGLAEAINTGQYLVPRMTRDERRAAIAGPIGVGGGEISPVLLTRLVNDVGDNPDQLSILQHALNRTWARWEKGGGGKELLDLTHYEAIGTMAHALDQHAEKAYAELATLRQQQICEKLFKALTDKATDPRGIRRPTTLGILCALTDATAAEVTAVIDVFRKPSRSFLMPPAGEPLKPETVIDISHESLMRVWQRLSTWAEMEAQSAQTYRRLAETAVLHSEGRAGLWQDPDLQVALDWRTNEQPNKTWADRYHAGFAQGMSFLDTSVTRRDEELRAQEIQRQEQETQRQRTLEQAQALAMKERQRAEEQARASKRFRWFAIALAIAFIGALGATGSAIQETRRAEQQTKLANQRGLEATALGHIKELDLSLLLSLEARNIGDKHENPDGLLHAMQQSPRLIAFLHGHNNTVRSVALRPDGKTLASGSWDNTIILWDLATRKQVGPPLTGHKSAVYSLAWSPDGATLASGSKDDTIILWDVDTKQRKLTLTDHQNSVHSLAWSPDGKTLASGSEDKTIRLWKVATGKLVRVPLTDHKSAVYNVAWSPDGKILASGSDDKTIILWDVATGRPVGDPFTGHTNSVYSLAWSPDGKILASGSDDKTIRLWEISAHRQRLLLTGHTDAVRSVAWSHDGATLASGSKDDTIVLWDVVTGQPLGPPLIGHTDDVRSVVWSLDGKILVSGGDDKTVRLWDVTTQRHGLPLIGHTNAVYSVVWSPDGKTLASGSEDYNIILWNAATHRPLRRFPRDHTDGVRTVAWSPDGKTLASGNWDKTVILWNVVTGQQLRYPPTDHHTPVRSVAWSPDGKTLASGSSDPTIRLWNVGTGRLQELHLPTDHTNTVYSLAWSADGAILASGSDDGIILWNLATGQPRELRLPTDHSSAVRSLAWSRDGKTLASGNLDNIIVLWDVATQRHRLTLVGHNSSVYSLAWSPDGTTLASGSNDKTIILWDVATGQPRGVPLSGHTDGVYSITWSPDGTTLASGGNDYTIRQWDVSTNRSVQPPSTVPLNTRACRIANRNFTHREWLDYMGGEPYRATCPELPMPKD